MSKIVTLRTDKPHRYGKSVNISGIKVEFDKLGFVDVAERQVEDLLKGGLTIVDRVDLEKFAKMRKQLEEAEKNNVAPVVDLHDENAKLKVEIEGLKKENEAFKAKIVKLEGSINLPTEKLEEGGEGASIDDMNKSELTALCKEIKFPEKEWSRLGVDKLRVYVKSKL